MPETKEITKDEVAESKDVVVATPTAEFTPLRKLGQKEEPAKVEIEKR